MIAYQDHWSGRKTPLSSMSLHAHVPESVDCSHGIDKLFCTTELRELGDPFGNDPCAPQMRRFMFLRNRGPMNGRRVTRSLERTEDRRSLQDRYAAEDLQDIELNGNRIWRMDVIMDMHTDPESLPPIADVELPRA